MKDPLTREQLLAQKTRREATLEKLRKEGAPQEAIAEMQKKLRLTQLRLDKMERTGDPQSGFWQRRVGI